MSIKHIFDFCIIQFKRKSKANCKCHSVTFLKLIDNRDTMGKTGERSPLLSGAPSNTSSMYTTGYGIYTPVLQNLSGARKRERQRTHVCAVLVTTGLVLLAVVLGLVFGLPPLLARQPPPDLRTPPPPSPSAEMRFQQAAVAADSAPCAAIAKSLLARGGSAVDAAVGALICQGVAEPHRSGLGGGLFMLVYHTPSSQAFALDARETAPAAASRDMFLGNEHLALRGGLSVAVPGEARGLWAAHQKFGTLTWADVIQPSVDLCEQGVPVSEGLAAALVKARDVVLKDPALRDTFTDPSTGDVVARGALFRHVRLAETLRLIARDGAEALYSGSLAQSLVEDLQDRGAVITTQDLEDYTALWKEAVSSNVPSSPLTIHSVPMPGSGHLLSFMLNVMEGFVPSDQGDIRGRVTFMHRLTETFKHAFARRPAVADPDFVNTTLLEQTLLSKDTAADVRSRINDFATFKPAYYGPLLDQNVDAGTSHVSVLAPDGTAVAVTSSINQNFGSGIMSNSTGIILNNSMDDFSSDVTAANSISPGKRPTSSMCPAVVVGRDGGVRLVVGAAGGVKITPTTAQVILRHFWLGEGLKESIDARRIHHQLEPNVLEYEFGVLEQEVEGLRHRGHVAQRSDGHIAVVNAVARVPGLGIVANADFRKSGAVDGL